MVVYYVSVADLVLPLPVVRCKQGLGIAEILEAVVERVPAPADNRGKPLRALIFDSYYDAYKVCWHWYAAMSTAVPLLCDKHVPSLSLVQQRVALGWVHVCCRTAHCAEDSKQHSRSAQPHPFTSAPSAPSASAPSWCRCRRVWWSSSE